MSELPSYLNEQRARREVVAEARTWIGTPFHHEARVKGHGVDCAMLLIEVYAAAGVVERIQPKQYPPDWHLHRSEERYLNYVMLYCHPVTHPQQADIAMFKVGRTYSHAAIVVAWPEVIHAWGYGTTQGAVQLDDISKHPQLSRVPTRFFSPWRIA